MTRANVWQGDLVRLRAVEPEDWEALFEWDADTEIARLSFEIPFPASREATKKWAAEQAVRETKDDSFRWVIEGLDGEFLGMIETHFCKRRHGTFQFGIGVRREHWRKGYASEAIRLILAYYFRELRYQKVNAHVYSFNEASLQLHRKLGFREEGRLRRVVFADGCYHDEVIFGMTAEEFQQSQEPQR
jgi:RimJ/RimL family protein N-acetyltransferase